MNDMKASNLSFRYKNGDKLILKDISVDIPAGEFVCLLGQSGCGKSTFLRLLAGLEEPTFGTIEMNGEPIKGAGLDRGVVFQDYGLFPWMTAGDNIMLALKKRFKDKSKKELKKIAMDSLASVGLKSDIFRMQLEMRLPAV